MTKTEKLSWLYEDLDGKMYDIKKAYNAYLAENGYEHLEQYDPIQWAVGLGEYEAKVRFEAEEELEAINYRGKEELALYLLDKIEGLL